MSSSQRVCVVSKDGQDDSVDVAKAESSSILSNHGARRPPRATGAAMNGLMSPRANYVPALAAAVTPIMKLLVVVDALSGARIRRSMAITLNRPLPVPSNLARTPHHGKSLRVPRDLLSTVSPTLDRSTLPAIASARPADCPCGWAASRPRASGRLTSWRTPAPSQESVTAMPQATRRPAAPRPPRPWWWPVPGTWPAAG